MAHFKTDGEPLVLVVEDEALIRLGTAYLLEDEGYTVIQAGNSAEALRVLEERADVRVLFTDIQMPGELSGLGLAHEVHARWPTIKLLITSGKVRPPLAEMPDEGTFIRKPYSPHDMTEKIGAMLSLDRITARKQ